MKFEQFLSFFFTKQSTKVCCLEMTFEMKLMSLYSETTLKTP